MTNSHSREYDAAMDTRLAVGLMGKLAAIMIAALKNVGAAEDRGRPNRGPVVDRFQPSWITADPSKAGVPWCTSSVCQWWYDGLGKHPYGKIIYGADALKDKAKAQGRWRDAWLPGAPRPGAAFVLLHSADTPGFDKGHAGLVLRVSEDERTIQTVEGNARNKVRIIQREVPEAATVNEILGFAYPVEEIEWNTAWQRGLLTTGFESPGGSTR